MSPEQARGKPVDERADIWAFGCVLYEMLTGRPPFAGEDVTSTLARVLERAPDMSALPKDVAPNVRHAIDLCLQKDVKKRIADIRDVKLALEGTLDTPSQTVQPVAVAAPVWRRAVPISAGLLAIAIAIVAGAYVWRTAPLPATVPAAPLAVTRFVVTPPATAPLANLGGYDVVISPDGQRLAYYAQDPQTGGVSLQVRELDGLEARRLPGTDVGQTSGNANPFFSPDGKWIGFRVGEPRGHTRGGRRRSTARGHRRRGCTTTGLPRRRVGAERYADLFFGHALAARLGRRRRHSRAIDA